jgi:hypothetical protein
MSVNACLQQQCCSIVHPERSLRYALTSSSNCLHHLVCGRIRNGLSPQALSSVGRKFVDRKTRTKNVRAMAATTVECSNTWGIVYGLRRVFIHRFRVAYAIADVISPLHSSWLVNECNRDLSPSEKLELHQYANLLLGW